MSEASLVADIGGTHARFALIQNDGEITQTQILKGADFLSLDAAYTYYRAQLPHDIRVTRAALAVAGPVTGDLVRITNQRWDFSQSEIKKAWNLQELYVINDFAAIALALPHLSNNEKIILQNGVADTTAPLAVLGPGTGLGVAGMIPNGAGNGLPLSGEGGHVTLAATNELEADLLAILHNEFGYVSAERILSGQGLVNLYRALAQHRGETAVHSDPAALATAAMTDKDPLALAALEQFYLFLGTVAGDVALTLGARGGVYLAGGILPRLAEPLAASGFARRFSDKAVVKSYLEAIPVWLITYPIPAFIGLRFLLQARD
jgi:glucokinase